MVLTLAQKIENLTWWNEIIKLKDILRSLLGNAPYKAYTALITQTSTNAPTATVLNNTTGQTIAWTYSEAGVYIGTFSGEISQDSVWFSATPSFEFATDVQMAYSSSSAVTIRTFREGLAIDDKLAKTPIEIRIYN